MSDKQWMQEFAKKLQQKMKYVGVDQRTLSKISGVSETTISRYLAAKQMPKIRPVMQIAKALNASILELISFYR